MDSAPLPAPEILLHHGEALRRLGRALLRDAHLAEDLAQDAFVRRIERAPRSIADEGSWLRVVLRHLGLNAARRRSVAAERERRAAREEALPSAADEVAHAELLRRVVDAVLELEEPYRETIVARYVRGLEARELAATSGVPLATVRSREQRALDKLRARLDRASGERRAWSAALATLLDVEGSHVTGLIAFAGGAKLAAGIVLLAVVGFLGWKLARPASMPAPLDPHPSVVSTLEFPTMPDNDESARDVEPRVPVAQATGASSHVTGRLVNLPCDELSLPAAPAAEIVVRIRLGKSAWEDLPSGTEHEVRTDEQGRFDLEIADTGERPISAVFTVDASSNYRYVVRRIPVAEGAGLPRDVELRRAPHGVLHGTTIDRARRPLAGVHVRLFAGNKAFVAEATSDENGTFRVEGLADAVVAEADLPGYTLLDADELRCVESGGWEPAQLILVPRTSLRIEMRDAAGSPVHGLDVSVSVADTEMPERPEPVWGARGPTLNATTDVDGVAFVEGVWTGARLQVALARGTQRSTARARDGSLLLFDAEPGTGTPIVAEVGRDLELEGRLVDLDVVGTVVDADRRPVPHPRVAAFEDPRGPADSALLLGVADGDDSGRFALSNRLASFRGPLRVVASDGIAAPPMPGAQWFGTPLEGAPPGSRVGVSVLPAGVTSPAKEVLIVLEPALEISGRVLGASGKPFTIGTFGSAQVWIAPAGKPSYASGPHGRIAMETADGGAFRTFAPDGLYDIFVSHGFGSSFWQRFPDVPAGSVGLELRLEGDETNGVVNVRVRAPRACALKYLQAKLLPHEPNAFPKVAAPHGLRVSSLAGWPTDAHYDFGGVSGTIDERGKWIFGLNGQKDASEIALPPVGTGWYVIGVHAWDESAHEFFPMATECLWFEPGEYTVDFDVVPTTNARGRFLADATREFLAVELVDSEGRSLPLRRFPGYGTPTRFLETDARGEFLLRNVPVGSFRLRAGTLAELRNGTARAELPLELVAGENEPIEVHF